MRGGANQINFAWKCGLWCNKKWYFYYYQYNNEKFEKEYNKGCWIQINLKLFLSLQRHCILQLTTKVDKDTNQKRKGGKNHNPVKSLGYKLKNHM